MEGGELAARCVLTWEGMLTVISYFSLSVYLFNGCYYPTVKESLVVIILSVFNYYYPTMKESLLVSRISPGITHK